MRRHRWLEALSVGLSVLIVWASFTYAWPWFIKVVAGEAITEIVRETVKQECLQPLRAEQ